MRLFFLLCGAWFLNPQGGTVQGSFSQNWQRELARMRGSYVAVIDNRVVSQKRLYVVC